MTATLPIRSWCRALALVLGMCLAAAVPGTTSAQDTEGRFSPDALVMGGGLSIYVGDLDSNPNSHVFKTLGASGLHAMVGAHIDEGKRSFGLELSYDRVSGQFVDLDRGNLFAFSNNVIGLEAVGIYRFSYVQDGFISIFAGVGPVLLLAPSYEGFPENQDEFEEKGTRPMLGLKAGIAIQDYIRLGVRFLPTDYLDGYEGVNRQDAPYDLIGFITLGYRLDLSN